MLRGIYFRLWIVATLIWYVYNTYVRWEQINRPEPHQWEAAFDYGFNKHLYCTFPNQFDCVKNEGIFRSGPQFDSLLEETLQLILVFGVLPLGAFLAGMIVLTVLGWIFRGSWRP